jgi:hypothetical protein
LAAGVVTEDRHAGTDLVGGKSGPAGFGHGVQQVGDQAGQGIVEAHHRLARRAQHRVAEQSQRADRHARARLVRWPPGDPSLASPLPARPLPARLLSALAIGGPPLAGEMSVVENIIDLGC